MGLAFNAYLDCQKIFGCKYCKTHLSNQDDIVSKVRLGPITAIRDNILNPK